MIGFRNLFSHGLKNPRGFVQVVMYLPQFVKLYGRLIKDPRVPILLRLVLFLAFVYIISPIDLFPDFLIPILGHLDDLFILLLALKFFLKKCPRDVLLEHVRQIESEI
ncbi:MAG: YkvA family protein [bacterium]